MMYGMEVMGTQGTCRAHALKSVSVHPEGQQWSPLSRATAHTHSLKDSRRCTSKRTHERAVLETLRSNP